MEHECQNESVSSEVVHALSPVVDSYHIVHKSSSEGVLTNHTQIKFTSSNSLIRRQVDNIIRRQVEEPLVEVNRSSTLLGRVLNMEQFGKVIGFVVVIVTQMSGSSEKLKNLSLCLLGAILVVYTMKLWVMPACKVKWKVIVFEIASMSTKLLCFYLLICMLKPVWLSWFGFVIVCIIAAADKFADELKTRFTWCYEKGVLAINYVIDKVLNSKCKDQASPASTLPCASV